jgi:AraC-like DNA-binding protein
MCVLKDELTSGTRVGVVSFNDVFKPSPKILPRALGGEYVFTKYHFHDGIEILRIIEGRATAVINNRKYSVSAGDVLIINPYEPHGLYLDSADSYFSRSCVIFKPRDIFLCGKSDTVFDRLRSLNFVNYIPSGTSLASCVDDIVSIAETKSVSAAVEEISALFNLYSVAIKEGALSDSETSYRSEFVTKITDYVEVGLLKEITTESAARYCKYSKEHFCRLFKASFGTTFKDYLTSCRIAYAKNRIDSGEFDRVSELSAASGFANPNYFSSMFLRHVGVSPSEYIKKRGIKK